MIDRSHTLSVAPQAKLLGFSRGSVYYSPRPVSDSDLALMRRIDELHLDFPFAGSRMLQGLLRGEGLETGRLHVATLMKRMGIEAIYRRPNTSKSAPGRKIYPYLPRKLVVTRPNQVWAIDLTYSAPRPNWQENRVWDFGIALRVKKDSLTWQFSQGELPCLAWMLISAKCLIRAQAIPTIVSET